jgi:hypothetical protein
MRFFEATPAKTMPGYKFMSARAPNAAAGATEVLSD